MTQRPDYALFKLALQRVLGPTVGVALLDPTNIAEDTLWPAEAAAIAKAIPERRGEFAAGRAALRAAMAAIDHPACAIPMGPDRAPVFPPSIIGSLSHTSAICAAVIALTANLRGLGIDFEPLTPLPDGVAETILTPPEIERQQGLPPVDQNISSLRIFSAKECAFKAQYALTGAMFGFESMEITLSDTEFQARFCADFPPFSKGDRLTGTSLIVGDHVVSALKIPN